MRAGSLLAWMAAAACLLAAMPTPAASNDCLLIVHPETWVSALEPSAAFKTRPGYSVTNVSCDAVAGDGALTPGALRTRLTQWHAGIASADKQGYVLLLGDFDVIPAASFRVLAGDSAAYPSDLYYRDLHSEFDANGNGVLGEYGTGLDFDPATFAAAFAAIRNDVGLGRLPIPGGETAEQVESRLSQIIAFEREVSPRKQCAIMTAGRITFEPAFPADSWEYVVRDIVDVLRSDFTNGTVTTVVHAAPGYTNLTHVDHLVEGNSIADYTEGQDIVRGLWESNDACSVLCNVSHGSATADFALTSVGAGLPTNVHSATVISLSCASYPLGTAAYLAGLAAAYFGSTANVTPDIPSFVSGEVQSLAITNLFHSDLCLAEIFDAALAHYIEEIPGTLLWLYDKPGILRNAVGFQMIGDPTLVHRRRDRDGDGLLDGEEAACGTEPDDPDSDGDEIEDGDEVYQHGTDPARADTDGDDMDDGDELTAGTDPLQAASVLVLTGVREEGDGIVLSWTSVTGRVYAVVQSTHLPAGDWTPVPGGTNVAGTGSIVTITNSPCADTVTFRVHVHGGVKP